MKLLEDLRRWGWREVVYGWWPHRTLCRLGWHTAACRGRVGHPRGGSYVEHRWPSWPPPPPYLLIDRGDVRWRDWLRGRR